MWKTMIVVCLAAALGTTAWSSPQELGTVRGLSTLAFCPSGSTLAVAGSRTVYLFDLGAAGTDRELSHPGRVNCVAYATDGAYLATGSWNEIRVWDAETLEKVGTLTGDIGNVMALDFAPDGSLIGGTSTGDILHWTPGDAEPAWMVRGHGSAILDIAVSEDGARIASCGADRTALWAFEGAAPLHMFPGRSWAVAFVPNGRVLIAAAGKTLRAWDTASGEELYAEMRHTGCIFGLAVSPDGALVASGSMDLTVRMWNADPGELLATWSEHTTTVQSVAFSPNGKLLASGDHMGRVLLWDLSSSSW